MKKALITGITGQHGSYLAELLLRRGYEVHGTGNLGAVRDWGYAKEYVEAMWRMLQADEPADYVVATGTAQTVRDFLQYSFEHVNLDWEKYVRFVDANNCSRSPAVTPTDSIWSWHSNACSTKYESKRRTPYRFDQTTWR